MTRERGAGLLAYVLVVGLVLVAAALAIGLSGYHRYRAARAKAEAWQAFLWAESGIDDAANRLVHDPFWRADGSETWPLLARAFAPDGRYEARVEEAAPPDRFRIVASGTHARSAAGLSQAVRLETPFLFALLARERIEVSGDAEVRGAVGAGGTVRLAGGRARIYGPVQAGEGYQGPAAAVETFQEGISPPSPGAWEDVVGGVAPSLGTWTRIPAGIVADEVYADTDVRIVGGTEVRSLVLSDATLVVEGNLRVTGLLQVEAPTRGRRSAVLVKGDLEVYERGNLRVWGPLFVAGRIRSSGRFEAHGTVMAERIELRGRTLVAADPRSAYAPVPGFPHGAAREALRTAR